MVLIALSVLVAAPSAAQDVVEVLRGSPLKPSGLAAGQTEFRVLFVTSTKRDASSTNIGDYNSFVQGRAGAGHSAIRPFSSKFKAVGSTSTTDARDNTSSTYTSANKGPPIYWLRGNKVADNYEDFYDGSWDEQQNVRNESGNAHADISSSRNQFIWTGSNNDGTKHERHLGILGQVRTGEMGSSSPGSPLSHSSSNGAGTRPLYGLSPLIRLINRIEITSVAISSTPGDAAKGYIEGERITIRVNFSEAMSASGAVFVPLSVGGGVERAVYASGSGTASLDFEYIVQRGDIDTNGVSLCTDTIFDRLCGNIHLNGGTLGATSDGTRPGRELPELDDQAKHKVDAAAPFVPNPNVGPEANPSMGIVPLGWSLRPTGVARGERFRLLTVTSTSRDATSAAIADYNTHVKNAAAAGHADVRAYSSGFRAVASTETVDARDNAALTGTGEKIFWLNGAQVADNYADFLDGSWDNRIAKNELGANAGSQTFVWTGSTNDGREKLGGGASFALGAAGSNGDLEIGDANSSLGGAPLSAGTATRTASRPLYGISQVLRVTEAAKLKVCIDVQSVPKQGDTYRIGETLKARYKFTEPVAVRGTPRLRMNLSSSSQVLMVYASGSGTDTLIFEYTVALGDISSPSGPGFGRTDEIIELDGADIRAVADNAPVNVGSNCATNWGRNHKVNAQRPTVRGVSVTSTPSSGGTYAAGETITVALAMNEDVRVTGAPSVMLDVGGAPRRMTYTGPIGTSTRTLSFNYTVVTADFDADGVSVCSKGRQCGAITLNGGSIRAAHGGLDANLRHPSQDAQTAHKVEGTPPSVSVSCPGERTVPSDWALKPSGISTGGKFRLMFISSGQRNAQSSNIADYNSFVQNSAGAGHSAIQPHRRSFRALASTGAVNARDNTCTTGGGTAIYWLNSSKVADNNADLYDGSWDDVGGRKHESGADSSGLIRVWTGSNADGTAAGNNGDDALGNNTVQRVTINFRDELVPAGAGPLFCGTGSTCKVIRSSTARLYGLSQVFVVGSSTTVSTGPTTTGASVISKTASAYRPGETIEIEVTFTEAVTVRGRPQLEILFGDDPLGLSGQIATYVRGSGTTKLVFSYEVTTGTPADTTGLNLSPNALRTGGTPITAVSDGVPAVYNLGDYDAILPAISVDPTAPLTGGVCARTPAIIPAIMALASQDPAGAPANCSEVTEQKLRAGIAAGGGTFDLDLHGLKLSSLKSGDFDWLNGMQTLNLSDNQLTSLPTRLFEGLNGMQTLNLRNNQLTSLPTRLFEGLNGIQTLNLGHNQLTSLPTRLFEELETLQRIQLESNQLTSLAKDTFASTPNLIEIDLRVNRLGASGLPDGIFEPLTTLLVVRLQGNPGTKSFKPMADAGEGRTVSAGETVTLSGTSTGPWGSNVTYAWRQLSATGEPVSTVELSATDVAKPTFTVPVLDEETTVKFELKLRGRGTFGPTHTSQPSEAVFTIKRLAVTGFAPASSPTTGAHFRMGETLEIAASFSDKVIVDTSGGTPRLALAIGASVGNPNRNAEYVRGSGTTELIFAYTVMRMDADNTGVSIAQNGLKANGGNITSVFGAPVPLGHAGVSNDTDLRVDWTMTPPSGGVCARTPKVRSELVTLVKESDSTVTDCSMVTATHLAGLTGTLDLSRSNVGEIRTLKQDDFEGLSALTNLEITSQTTLQRVPAGVFDPMTSLTTLRLDRNGNATDTGLSTLPPKVFDRLTRLRTLNLSDNDLATLAPRIFERLTAATQISVGSNPGTASFKPIAMAGPTGGMDAVAGTTVTLSVEGSEHGREDPWGSNVTYAWTQTEGTPVTLSNASGARPTFAAQVRTEDETLAFTVTVTGKGGTIMSTSSTQVRIATGPAITALEWVSTPRTRVNFTDYYGIGETIELGVRFERAVTVDTTGGTPSIVLELANEVRKNASYQRGSGTAQLVFGYTVKARDLGQEGVLVPANSLTLAAGTIQGATGNGAAIGHRRLDRDILHGVWGTSTEGTTESGGVCDRTTGVAAAIIANVRNREFDPLNEIGCSDIGAARLGAITGTLDVSPQATASGRMTSLKAGDFAGLTALTGLNLNDHALRIFPAGVFDPLSALTSLTISYNQTQATDSLMTLPAGLFDRLTRLRTLRLTHNDLEKLPNALFEDLVNLRTLALDSNPGTANFVPAVNSGADAEIDAQAGDTVTLDATGDVTRGPWGTNVTYAWRQASGATVTLSATNTAKPTFTAPAHADGEAQTLVLEGVVTGKGTSAADGHHATSTWTVEIAAGATTSGPATVPRAPRLVSNPKSDATYKLGETIEVEVRFTKAITVSGTPQLAVTVGANTRNASYVASSSSLEEAIRFRYTIGQADTDTDGIAIAANAITLNGATIVDAAGTAATLDHAALATQTNHKVNGAQSALTGGICARTTGVRDELAKLVKANNDTVANCSLVTNAHLEALSSTLDLSSRTGRNNIREFKSDDFAGLSAVTYVAINGQSDLTTIPANLFDPMTSLTTLDIGQNGNATDTGLSTLPSGVFDRLTTLTVLNISSNDLLSLPPRILERLTKLTGSTVAGNPGTDKFAPTAKAGPEDGIDAGQGRTTTLGVEGAELGFDDPWGTNVTYAWTQTAGTTVTLSSTTAARPTFSTPSTDETLTFRLTVRGRGGSRQGTSATSTVDVRVGAAAGVPMLQRASVSGATLTLTYDKDLKSAAPAQAGRSGAVFAALVSDGMTRSTRPVRISGARASARTVTMTMNPPIGHGEFLTLSYFPANATEATQIQDTIGNTAARFTGKRVRNETPEPPHIDEIAFADEAQTYAIGAIIGIEATFSETVTVTTRTNARPRLELIVGSNRRHALYISGSGSNTLRLEYTVVDGDSDSDSDGIGFARNSFETPTGSTIATSAASAAVDLDHFPSEPGSNLNVDGIRPAVASGSASGLELTLTFAEGLDESATPAPSSFTVTTKSGSSRTVTGVTVEGRDVKLALARGIAPGNGAATVDYTAPAADAVRDLVGNTAQAFEDQSVNVAAVPNNVASGTVTIAVQGAGAATVGQTVQGTIADDVEDPDGLESPTYTYQWVRVDGSNEADIAGATATSYTLTASDAGKKLKLKASFRDILNNGETLTSAVWPTSTRITWAADANCGRPSEITNGTREQIWTGQVTVGTETSSGGVTLGYGYSTITSTGSLSDTTFELSGTTYTIAGIAETALSDSLTLTLTSTLGTTSTSGLKLHACDATFEFSSATHTVFQGQSTYQWTSSGLDWSTVTTRRLYLTTADTRAPVLVRATVNGPTLTLTYDERLKVTSPTMASTRDIMELNAQIRGFFEISDIEAGVGSGGQNVTMTISPPAHQGENIDFEYNGVNATETTRIQDRAGNEAANGSGRVENRTPDNPRIDTIGFAGTAEPYGGGETIAIDAVFTESVTVTGRPTIAMDIGAETRKALWKTGQTPGTTHRFEYTVQASESDESGPDILVNGLTAPTGSTITTTADGAAVLLGHQAVKGGSARYVDGVPPTLRAGSGDTAPVQVTGPTITVAWNEALDETSVPAGSRFTVTVTPMGDPAQTREVTEVSIAGKIVTLALDRVATVSLSSTVTLIYAVPTTNPLRDLVGNNAAALDAQSVKVFGATNNVATARFTFENSDASVNVGDSMRVLAQITDADGFATDGKLTSRLLRVEGTTERVIATKEESVDLAEGTTTQRLITPTPNYTLVRADAGKRLKLEVSFEDFAGTEEMIASRTWPDDPIAWNASACAMPSDIVSGSRHLVWTGEMTLGTLTDGMGTTQGYGYTSTLSGSSLSDKTFTIGSTTHTIDKVIANPVTATVRGVVLDLNAHLPPTQVGNLQLHVCNESLAFNLATYNASEFSYGFTTSQFDWSTVQTRRLYISSSDGAAPSLVRATVDGAVLTLTYSEQLKVTNPIRNNGTSAFLVAVIGGDQLGASNNRSGVGPRGRDVTITLAPPARPGQELGVSYHATNVPDGTKVQDRAGNQATAFLRVTDLPGSIEIENLTREGPGVARTTFANTGPYAIGDTIEVDVVFSESVTVIGRPVLALEIGEATLDALWKTGQSAGATQRFEYTVVEGDLDADGFTVMVNGLATTDTSTIETSEDATDVLLGHTAASGGSGRRVDGVRATIASAEAVSKTLTMTWSEALDGDTVPAANAFTVDAGASGSRRVTNVEVSGSAVTLTLARGIAADTANVTVDYEPPATNALRDTAGNDAEQVTDQAITAVQGVNNPATGRVTFFGTGTVGQTVNATVSGLVDEDGLEAVTYTYQWVRVEGSTESDIADATGAGYTMTAADAGKRLKLKASFTDFLNNAETLTSAPWPAAEPVAWTQNAACAMPAELVNGTRDFIWTAELGVERAASRGRTAIYGYSNETGVFGAFGSLSDTTFTLAENAYAIKDVQSLPTVSTPRMEFTIEDSLPTTRTTNLKLHVCSESFDFSSASYIVNPGTYLYSFSEPGLDWSSVATRRLYLSVPDATPPVLSAMEVNAAKLTMIYDEPLKTTAPTRSGGGNPTIVVKRSGKTGTITVSNVRAGTGTNGNEVTMTLNPALEHGDRIEITYDRTNTVTASRIQDLSGNKAVALRSDSSVVNTTPSGPSVTGIAFAGAETVYAIGDVIAVDVTFNERVRVTGEPTIMLGVGSTPRTARWKMGQAPGTVQRFEYTVAEGEIDADGAEVVEDTLVAATGSTVRTAPGNEAVVLAHEGVAGGPGRTVDGVRPSPLRADAAGPTLTITWDETLDPSAVPTPGRFSVSAGTTGARTVREVEVEGRSTILTLARGIAATTANVTVAYDPPAVNGLRDAAGNTAAEVSAQEVSVTRTDNNVASGQVTISGTAMVGETVQAAVSGVTDPDGLNAPTAYTYQWVRVDGATETDISGGTGADYILTGADAGKKLRVKARFTDFLDNPETLTSDPWPALESVQWPVDSACATPSELVNETHDQVWTAQMGVGARVSGGETISYGYGTALSSSMLSDTTFTLGTNDYTVSRIELSTVMGSIGTLLFGTPEVTTTGLALHVCAATLEFSDATYNSALSGYLWTSTGLDWSMVQTRRVYLSKADTTVPVLERVTINASTVTLTYDERLKVTSPEAQSGSASPNPFVVGTQGATDGNATIESNVRAGVGPGGRNVTITIAPPARHGQTLNMAYFSTDAVDGTQVQDPAGNNAAGFVTSPVTIENTTPEGPSVEAIAFAGDEEPYGIGATIAIDVTFNESVRVTGGRPTLALEVGENTRSAVWKSGQSAGATHRFEYTVVEGELDIDGPEVTTNGLEAAGATIRTTTGNKAVVLGHGAVAGGANRAVDAVRPTMASAEVAGPTLTVTWDETLDETSVPENAGGFRVKIGSANGPAVNAVASISGSIVTLTLASAVADGTMNVTLEYRAPRSGATIRDATGNDAANATGADAVSVMVRPDTKKPEIARAEIDATMLTVTFDEALDESAVPTSPGGFTVAVTRAGSAVPGHTISALSVAGTSVTLTVAPGVATGDAVTLTYVKPATNPLRDLATTPNEADPFDTVAVENRTGALMVTLSKTEVVEGDDARVVFNVAREAGTSATTARVITITPDAAASAAETADWTIADTELTIAAGETEASTNVTIVDDAVLEGAETVTFTISVDGIEAGSTTIEIADDDRAVLSVQSASETVTEGTSFAVTLRLDPHQDNAPDAVLESLGANGCFLDFAVDAELAITGDDATPGATHTFAATGLDSCTRSIDVTVPTLSADSQWRIARPLTLTLSPASGADARVETGSAKTVTVQDNTPQPGPVVMEISASPVPSGASSVGTSPVTKNAFFRLPRNAVHSVGRLITFTVRFDIAVTVTGSPQLKLDLHGIEHRAPFYNGSGTNTLKFMWRVGEGDNDADGIAVQGIALNGGTIRDAQARDTIAETFPVQTLTEHRVRGGLYAMWLDVEPQRRAIEGEKFEIRVKRKGSFDEWAVMVIEVTDNAVGTTSNPNTRWNTDPSEGRKRSYPVWFAAGHQHVTGVSTSGRTITPKPANQTPNGPRLLTVRIVEVDATHLSNTTPDCKAGRPGCPDTPPEPFDTTQIQWHEKGEPASFTVRVDPPGRQARIGPRVIEFPSVTAPGEETGYVADERIEARVEFEAPVTVDTTRGTPTLGLALGGVRRETTYESGSGSTVLVFARTASAADAGEEAAKAIANGLMENGARIRGENGRPASLEFGIAPGVAEVTIAPTPGDDGAWTQGEPIEVHVRFEEPVNVDTAEGTPSIEVMTSSGAVRQATWVRGSLTDTLRFSYTLAPEDGASTSILVAPDALVLNDGAIYSTGGLHVTLDHNGVGRTADNGFIEPTVPTVSVADAEASEGERLDFAVTLSTAHSAAVTVDYTTSDGSASAGSDYTHESGTLLFAPGETAKTVAVAVLTDTDPEGTETVTLTLSNATGATIASSAATGRVTDVSTVTRFTAAFGSFPPEHDGSTKFTLHLRFSEEPAEMSYKTVRDTLFNVTGGEVKKARRLNAPSNQGFEITIKPAGNGAATLELATGLPACGASGSVCAPDGRRLEGPLAVTVPGPVAISVADAEVDEEPGAKLAFVVTLDRARHAAVTVDYATSDGTAVAGEDYTAESGTLSFTAGETAKTVEVAVLDDSHDEGSETMMFTLSNASGARIADGLAIGTINNSDVMPRAWLLRFGRTVGSQVVDALNTRLEGAGAGGSHVIVAGINIVGEAGAEPEVEDDDPFGLPEWATSAGREADAQTITGEDIRLRSAFHLSSGAQEPGAGPAFTAWGRVASGGFEAEEDGVTMDGTVTTGFVGFDAEWERILAGVMISQSEGEGSYRQLDPELGDDAGTVESSLTGVYPYARVDLNANVSAWALAGAGSGELTLHREGGERMDTDILMRMGAIGVKGRVLDGTGPSGVGLNVKSDAMWVGTKSADTDQLAPTEGDVTRLRLILQGDRTFEAGNGSTFTPSAEIGLRHDGGDAETGTGVEVGAGLRYTIGAVTIEAQARTLIAHEASGYKEWGASGAIRVTPSASGRGLTLSIAPAWGHTGSAAERLWSAHDARAFGSDQDFEASSRLEMDGGYGFGLPGNRGVLTPYAGLALGEAGDRTVRAGTRWQFGPDVVVGLEATRQTSDAGEGANEVRLRAALRF